MSPSLSLSLPVLRSAQSGFSINGSFHFALHDKYDGVCVCVCLTNWVQQFTPMYEWFGSLPACKTQQQDLTWPAKRESWHSHSMGIWIFVWPFWTIQSFCHSNWTTQRIGATSGSDSHAYTDVRMHTNATQTNTHTHRGQPKPDSSASQSVTVHRP